MDEQTGTADAVDVARIIAKEYASESGKCAHHVGLPGNWGLYVIDVIGGDKVGVLVGGVDFRHKRRKENRIPKKQYMVEDGL